MEELSQETELLQYLFVSDIAAITDRLHTDQEIYGKLQTLLASSFGFDDANLE